MSASLCDTAVTDGTSTGSTENLERVGLAVHEVGPVSVTEEIEKRPVLNKNSYMKNDR